MPASQLAYLTTKKEQLKTGLENMRRYLLKIKLQKQAHENIRQLLIKKLDQVTHFTEGINDKFQDMISAQKVST